MARAKVMTVMRLYAQDEVNQEESERNEEGKADSTGKEESASVTQEVPEKPNQLHFYSSLFCYQCKKTPFFMNS